MRWWMLVGVAAVLVPTVFALGAPKTAAKWEGPWVPIGLGGKLRTTIYYGPWKCRATFMNACRTECSRKGHRLMGCIWIADIKSDYEGIAFVKRAGGRAAISHCCCDYPTASDLDARRKTWERGRDKYRQEWSKEFGEWPMAGKEAWPGHHVMDLLHGGDPLSKEIFPIPKEVHYEVTAEYKQCYQGANGWNTAGPDYPYGE
ncbi:MAG TPA: hypothetical protein VK447_12650 [Myxococcaceae bacterium]|nr:hypothetical protein [Myxococcaceae bacterium]